jgi:hypothetical protein
MSVCPYCEELGDCLCDDCEAKIVRPHEARIATLERQLAEVQTKRDTLKTALEQAREVVFAARLILQRIDHDGGLGEYLSSPVFVVKRLRDALAALDAVKETGK